MGGCAEQAGKSPGVSRQPKIFGQSNGKITQVVSGGTAPYTYLWSNAKTTINISVLPEGTYSVNIADAAGCTKANSATLVQPPAIALLVDFTAVGTSPQTYNAEFMTSGGTPGVSPNPEYTYSRTGQTAYFLATDPVFDNLPANTTYTFRAKDANGCVKSVSRKTLPAFAPGNTADRSEQGRDLTEEEELLPDEVLIPRLEREFSATDFEQNGLFVFPNPASNFLNISLLENAAADCDVEIFNALGQRAGSQNLRIEAAATGQIEVGHLPPGAYRLVVRTGGQRFEKAFSILRN